MDEKSQIQALQPAQPILPMDVGQPERRTHNYVRHGTVDLFAALNVATGEVIAGCKGQHRVHDFVAFLREIGASVEPGHPRCARQSLGASRAPRAAVAAAPSTRPVSFHAGLRLGLNLVERFFGLRTEKALKRGSHTSIAQLRPAILADVEAHNERSAPFKWVKTADEILDSMRRFGLRVQQVHAQ